MNYVIKMQIRIRPGYDEIESQDYDLRVIIDVFRASTTVVAILESGAAELVIANELSVLKKLSSEGFLVISEVFDLGLDNSPTLVKKWELKGKKAALKTSNLTTALEKNDFDGDLVICCFNNLDKVTQTILGRGYQKIEIIPAGLMAVRQMNVEDIHCAEILRDSLVQNKIITPNLDLLEYRIREKCEGKNRESHYIDDLNLAIQANISRVVPIVKSKTADIFHLTALA